MANEKIRLTGGSVFTKNGFEFADLIIEDGRIFQIKSPEDTEEGFIRTIEIDGLTVLPSFVDMHVHLREPGFSYKETIKTGTAAAAAGGFTTVCTMPNLKPAPDSKENLDKQLDIIQKDACIRVLPFATITKGREGQELVNYDSLAPYVAGFSDDGTGVQSEEVMRKAMTGIAKTGKILAAHCEVESLLDEGYIHDGQYALQNNHKGISSESEWKEVERDIRLAEDTGCRLHICHVSTKESVDLIRHAKQKGIKVTCETAPHYLIFTDMDLHEDGRFKMNPPIRSGEDREALRKGLIDGTIDVIATDHAPHTEEEKSKGLEQSSMGVVGLETSFGAVYTALVKSGLMTIERLIEVMAAKPREILGLPPMGYITEGIEANLAIVDINEAYKVDSRLFKSQGHSTPFDGMKLYGKIIMTFLNGNPVYIS